MACPCFAREGATEPFWTRGHGGTGLQFLNWSCRRQPFHRLAAAPLSLHPKGGPRSIPTLYKRERSTRPFLRGATPLATVCHGALLSARECPWCVISSPARLHGLCIWMPKALATELGPRTVASRSCAVPTWHAVPASGWCCRRQPAPCTPPRCFEFTVRKAFARWLARALLAKAPPSRSGLVVTGVPGCSS